ncbi:hypothetical protein I1C53_002990, partial [Listeria monocytogenes]|nr:hypothetical protein [Listeria monocytogenes]
GIIIVSYSLYLLYKIFKNRTIKFSIKQLVLSLCILIIGIWIFPSMSNSEAGSWYSEKFFPAYSSSVYELENSRDSVAAYVTYLGMVENENYDDNFFASVNKTDIATHEDNLKSELISLKKSKQSLEEIKAPWYLSDPYFKGGNKIINNQIEILKIQIKDIKSYLKQGPDNIEKSYKRSGEIEEIQKKIDSLILEYKFHS